MANVMPDLKLTSQPQSSTTGIFPISLMVAGYVSLSDWLHTDCMAISGHPS